MEKIKFIDLCAGIGGFHLALNSIGAKCVYASEINEHARNTYLLNFNIPQNIFNKDIQQIRYEDVPNHDILCAGFPCQPFSQAGKKMGFNDTGKSNRGNLFFNIAEVVKHKRPKSFILENVRYLMNHDNGRTMKIILSVLKELNYDVNYKVLKASDFNVPQNRPRLFIVGFNKDQIDTNIPFQFPEPVPLIRTMSDIFKAPCTRKIGYTLRVGGRGSKLGDRRNWEFYEVENSIKRIGIYEAKLMMGFPENFQFNVSDTQAMKQLGNSVCVDVVKALVKQVAPYIEGKQSPIQEQ